MFNNIQLKHIISLNGKMKKVERHSQEWYDRRMTSFGGSEMSKVICEIPTWKDIKLNNNNNNNNNKNSNEFCLWGLMFEEIAITHILKSHATLSYAFSETLFDTRLPISYSPDGFLYDNDNLYLVEIKCPFYRSILLPIKDDYIYQIQTGMYICNVPSCKFFQFDFVICFKEQLLPIHLFDFNLYAHHRKWKVLHTKPILKGYYIFKETDKIKGPKDIGQDIKLLNELDTVNKETYVFKIMDEIEIPKFTAPYLCWKLLDYNEQQVEKIHDFITSKEQCIWKEFKTLINSKI